MRFSSGAIMKKQAQKRKFLNLFKNEHGVQFFHLERKTGIEPATSALARLRYTTKPLPHVAIGTLAHFCPNGQKVSTYRLIAPYPQKWQAFSGCPILAQTALFAYFCALHL